MPKGMCYEVFWYACSFYFFFRWKIKYECLVCALMSKTYTICTVIRSIKIEYLEAKDSKKIHRDIWEIREPWNVLEMGILYEALCGSDSVCKGSNPFTAAKTKRLKSQRFQPFFLCFLYHYFFTFFVREGFIYC